LYGLLKIRFGGKRKRLAVSQSVSPLIYFFTTGDVLLIAMLKNRLAV